MLVSREIRRNVVTRDVPLLGLLKRDFTVGDVVMRDMSGKGLQSKRHLPCAGLPKRTLGKEDVEKALNIGHRVHALEAPFKDCADDMWGSFVSFKTA